MPGPVPGPVHLFILGGIQKCLAFPLPLAVTPFIQYMIQCPVTPCLADPHIIHPYSLMLPKPHP